MISLKAQLIAEKGKLKETISNPSEQRETLKKIEVKSETAARKLNKKVNKKVSFHLEERSEIAFTKKKVMVRRKEKKPQQRKKKNRQNYVRNKKKKKKDKIQELVQKIKEENIVVNLSTEEIPASAFLFLAKGLGFVPSVKVDPQDLKYDTLEFIRKLEWKAFFHQNPELRTDSNIPDIHHDIKISNFSQAPFQHGIIDDLKTKLLGWIANHEPTKPKSNLTPLEMRGRKWVKEKIKAETIFITKADKGEATLITN